MFDRLSFIIGEAFQNLRRHGFMTFSAIAVVAISLTIIGGLGFLYSSAQEFARTVPGRFDIAGRFVLLVPGGARSLIKLAQTPHSKRVVSAFIDDQKPVALVGDGVEILVIADRAEGMTVTGAEQSRAALEGAKAVWSEEATQLSGNVLTATGVDMPQFIAEMTSLFIGQEQVRDAA